MWFGAAALALGAFVLGLVRWRRLSPWARALGCLPAAGYTLLILLSTYGPPTTDLVITYQGRHERMLVESTTHYGASRTELKRGKPRVFSSGKRLRHINVAWQESLEARAQQRQFDLSKQVPALGRDRTILILIQDDGAACEVKLGRSPCAE